MIYTFNNPTG